jgi:hypothetical protein
MEKAKNQYANKKVLHFLHNNINVHHFFFPIPHCIAVMRGLDIEVLCKQYYFFLLSNEHSYIIVIKN